MKHLGLRLIPWALAALGAAGLSALSKLPYWASFVIVAVALFANGLLATLEDDLPGGFNNPTGTETPSYVRYVGWAVRSVAAVAVLLCIIIFVALARS